MAIILGSFGMMISFLIIMCYVVAISFTLWMAIDAGKQDRFWWLVLIVSIPIIGAVIYFITEKKHEYGKVEPHHLHTTQTEEEHEHAPKAS
jgi:hypothetical protein